MSRTVLASLLASLLLAPAAWAANINTTLVRAGAPTFGSMAVDASTGKVYESITYHGGNGSQIRTYASVSDFEANISSGSLATTPLWGTYLAAMNGSVYGRSSAEMDHNNWPVDEQWAKLDGGSGALQSTHQIAGMHGSNFYGFNWGGFSNINAMSDGDYLYAFGGADTGGWRINRFDSAMNLLSSTWFDGEQPGYGFVLGGYLFLGDSYASNQISRRVNTLTGAVEVVDFDLLGLGASLYLNGISYDALNDALYLHNYDWSQGGAYYKISGAFAAFGGLQVDFDPGNNKVPEPASLALGGLALLLAGGLRRKARQG